MHKNKLCEYDILIIHYNICHQFSEFSRNFIELYIPVSSIWKMTLVYDNYDQKEMNDKNSSNLIPNFLACHLD